MTSFPLAIDDLASLEFGFIGRKSIKKYNIDYNSFVSAFILQKKITYAKAKINNQYPQNLIKAAILGFKAGLIIPTNSIIGLSLYTVLGYGKSVIQKDPWFGRLDATLKKSEIFLAELGVLYYYRRLLVRPTFIYSNVNYLKQEFSIALGINF